MFENNPLRLVTPSTLTPAAAHPRAGRLVAFPAETVYSLGADAGNGLAAAVFAAKGRPPLNLRSPRSPAPMQSEI